MKVLRRNGQQAPASGSGAKSAAGAGTGPPTVPGTTGSSSSRPGIKIVSRAAQPPKPTYTGPSPEEVESRKVAELLLRLVLDLSASADADVSAAAADDNNSNIFEICDGANDVAAVVALAGLSFLQSTGLLTALAGEVQDGEEAEGREAALLGLKQLCGAVGRACEPYLVPLLPLLLERLMDKAPAVRQAAGEAAQSLAGALCPHAVKLALPMVLKGLEDSQKWQVKEGALRLLTTLADAAPAQVSGSLPVIVPLISERMVDAREQVQDAAAVAGSAVYRTAGNRDIEHLLDELLSCVVRPEDVADVVTKLSATTFVQTVDAPALAVMVPLLLKGLRESTPVQRRCCVIITNMTKLVNSPVEAAAFLPKLLPHVEKIVRAAADPELREVATNALSLLERVSREGQEAAAEPAANKVDWQVLLRLLKQVTANSLGIEVDKPTLDYVAQLATLLFNSQNREPAAWQDAVVPYLAPFFGDEGAEGVCSACLGRASQLIDAPEDTDGWDLDASEAGAEELCNCRFSLAYGGKILLNSATLRLVRGRRYGLCGGNGVGKSTLMRAISRGQLEGFPPPEKLKTVYVEHDIQASLSNLSVPDYIAEDPLIKDMGVSREQVVTALKNVGFTEDLLAKLITEISGGWKMKLALERAMLLAADILLLDEPTNHLDVHNVAWLEQYLISQPNITCITVSHDSGFLETVCTDIIHFDKRQLRRYKGNLSEFVKAVPTAKSYYKLEAATLRFRFPTPGLLDGINSKEKHICKLTDVAFRYGAAGGGGGAASSSSKPPPPAEEDGAVRNFRLADVNVAARLSSRVAVIGPNGAGKSTLIKIMTGELKASSGTVWRHPNLRMAYVAQHAFHHLEEHLDISPVAYMFKRFGLGLDQEEANKVDRQAEEEEKVKMAAATWNFDGHPRRFREILSRRKKKKDFEYEVAWQGLASLKFNRWIPRTELIEKGFRRFVVEFDQHLATNALGNDARPLTKENITNFLDDFGLEPEFGLHSHIRGLSGGQKVKLVLAAAMWNNPHLLIMDEPTNYLDREALGALAAAIKTFDGGVLLISHNCAFTSSCCTETWRVEQGQVTVLKEPPPSR